MSEVSFSGKSCLSRLLKPVRFRFISAILILVLFPSIAYAENSCFWSIIFGLIAVIVEVLFIPLVIMVILSLAIVFAVSAMRKPISRGTQTSPGSLWITSGCARSKVSFQREMITGIGIIAGISIQGSMMFPNIVPAVVFDFLTSFALIPFLGGAYVAGVLFYRISEGGNERNVMAMGNFIRESVRAGTSVEQITIHLRAAGWSEDQIRMAFSLENVPYSG